MLLHYNQVRQASQLLNLRPNRYLQRPSLRRQPINRIWPKHESVLKEPYPTVGRTGLPGTTQLRSADLQPTVTLRNQHDAGTRVPKSRRTSLRPLNRIFAKPSPLTPARRQRFFRFFTAAVFPHSIRSDTINTGKPSHDLSIPERLRRYVLLPFRCGSRPTTDNGTIAH